MNVTEYLPNNYRSQDHLLPIIKTALYRIRRSFHDHKRFLPNFSRKRIELRRSSYLILSHLVHWLDLSSARSLIKVGIKTYKEFTVQSIATTLNLSWSATQRALAYLTKSGYITSTSRWVGRGKSVSRYVIKAVLFTHVGFRMKDIAKACSFALNSPKRFYKKFISKSQFEKYSLATSKKYLGNLSSILSPP